MSLYDALDEYLEGWRAGWFGFLGKDYAWVPSRDGSAKGAALLGIKRVSPKASNAIHRSNLVAWLRR